MFSEFFLTADRQELGNNYHVVSFIKYCLLAAIKRFERSRRVKAKVIWTSIQSFKISHGELLPYIAALEEHLNIRPLKRLH